MSHSLHAFLKKGNFFIAVMRHKPHGTTCPASPNGAPLKGMQTAFLLLASCTLDSAVSATVWMCVALNIGMQAFS